MKILQASARAMVLSNLLLINAVASDEKQNTDAQSVSLELLEFVGDWTTQDGQWQDPMELLPMDDLDDSDKSKKGDNR